MKVYVLGGGASYPIYPLVGELLEKISGYIRSSPPRPFSHRRRALPFRTPDRARPTASESRLSKCPTIASLELSRVQHVSKGRTILGFLRTPLPLVCATGQVQ